MKPITKFLILNFCMSAFMCHAQTTTNTEADRQQSASLNNLKLESGAVIQDCHLGYRTYGRLNSDKTNGVLFLTWFMGSSKNIEQYLAPWKAVDTTRYCLILVDALGNGVSSSPSNSVKQHGSHFPAFTIRDMVQSQYQLLTQKFNIKHLHAIMGVSMGGFQTFQWGISYPDFTDILIPIVGSPQLNGYDLVNFNILRKVIEADSAFNHGNYTVNPIIAPASMYMGLNLTSPAHIAKTIPRENFSVLLHGVETSKNGADWNDSYYQVLAILGQDIAKNYNGSLAEAAKHIKAKMLIISSLQDHSVSPEPAVQFSKLLPAKLIMFDSELGHQAVNFDDAAEKKGIMEILAGKDQFN